MRRLWRLGCALVLVACGENAASGRANGPGEQDAAADVQYGADAATDGPGPDAASDGAGPDAPGEAADAATDEQDSSADDATPGDDGGPAIVFHEPPGMAVQIDTGKIPGALPADFQMYSPVKMTAEGETSANLVAVPDGTGLRLLYNPSLHGGYSPVRFGHGIDQPGASTYYQRWRMRTVANWAGPRNGNGVKLCEPRQLDQGPGGGAGTNHILMMYPSPYGSSNGQMGAMEGLQGPNGHFANLVVNQGMVASLTDGAWHWDERVYIAETSPGSGDGQYLAYLDGVLVAKYTDVQWIDSTSTWGIAEWLVDPTFGGAPESTHPLAGDFWDFDELYVSTK